MARPRIALVIAVAVAAVAFACGEPTPERIDRWPSATDGAARLLKVFRRSDLDPELRARAAAHLVTLGETEAVMKDLAASPHPALIPPLIRFLSDDARVASELQVPTPSQVAAKDALFDLRAIVPRESHSAIDAALLDWFTGYYDGRAGLGRHPAEEVVAAVGSDAATRLIPLVLEIVRSRRNQREGFTPVSDELLRGLAFAGPLGAAAVLDFAEGKVGRDHADTTFQSRAAAALTYAFSAGRHDRRVLVPLLTRITALAEDPKRSPAVANLAFDLLGAAGKPQCLGPLARLAGHDEEIRVIMAVRKGIECAGADGIIPMAEALRADRDVNFETVESFFWDEIAKLGGAAAPRARTLLSSKNWIARLTGVKVLRQVGDRSDVARLRALEGDRAPLRGTPGKDTKRAAKTVGDEARRGADHLEKKS
jgi:HEAT repeat protein